MSGTSRPVRITDTTLRDGSHAMSHQFTEEQVRATTAALDAAGVEVIEVSHGDGIGGASFNYRLSPPHQMKPIGAPHAEAPPAEKPGPPPPRGRPSGGPPHPRRGG